MDETHTIAIMGAILVAGRMCGVAPELSPGDAIEQARKLLAIAKNQNRSFGEA